MVVLTMGFISGRVIVEKMFFSKWWRYTGNISFLQWRVTSYVLSNEVITVIIVCRCNGFIKVTFFFRGVSTNKHDSPSLSDLSKIKFPLESFFERRVWKIYSSICIPPSLFTSQASNLHGRSTTKPSSYKYKDFYIFNTFHRNI